MDVGDASIGWKLCWVFLVPFGIEYFRLFDGDDSPDHLTCVVFGFWSEKENGPRTVKDVKLISAGRILENNITVGECMSPLCDIPGGVTTMHVVVQPPPQEKGQRLCCISFFFHSFFTFFSHTHTKKGQKCFILFSLSQSRKESVKWLEAEQVWMCYHVKVQQLMMHAKTTTV